MLLLKGQENIHLLVAMYATWRDKQKLLKRWVWKGHWDNPSLCWLFEFLCFMSEYNRIIQLSSRSLWSLHVVIQHKIDKIEAMHYTIIHKQQKSNCTSCKIEATIHLHVWNGQRQLVWYFPQWWTALSMEMHVRAYFGNSYHFSILFGVWLIKD